MAQNSIRTKPLSDVPPMRRFCEHPDHMRSEQVPVAAFIISHTSRNAALRDGLYVCAEHADLNSKFVVARIAGDKTAVVQRCPSACLAFDGGHEEFCDRREQTVPPSPAWSVANSHRVGRDGAL